MCVCVFSRELISYSFALSTLVTRVYTSKFVTSPCTIFEHSIIITAIIMTLPSVCVCFQRSLKRFRSVPLLVQRCRLILKSFTWLFDLLSCTWQFCVRRRVRHPRISQIIIPITNVPTTPWNPTAIKFELLRVNVSRSRETSHFFFYFNFSRQHTTQLLTRKTLEESQRAKKKKKKYVIPFEEKEKFFSLVCFSPGQKRDDMKFNLRLRIGVRP